MDIHSKFPPARMGFVKTQLPRIRMCSQPSVYVIELWLPNH